MRQIGAALADFGTMSVWIAGFGTCNDYVETWRIGKAPVLPRAAAA